MGPTGHRFSRRQALMGMAAAAGVGVLSGCARAVTGKAGAASLSTAKNVTEVYIQLYVKGVTINATTTKLVQDFVDSSFNATHKGIHANYTVAQNLGSIVGAMLAGSKQVPMVVSSCCADWPVILPYLEQLDPYLSKDNVNIGALWGTGQLSSFQTSTGLFGLPEDGASEAYIYRADIINSLGYNVPEAGWTYTEAEQLWTSLAGSLPGGKWRWAATTPWGLNAPETLNTMIDRWGGQFMNAAGTVSLLDSKEAIAAGEWWWNQVYNNVLTSGGGTPNPKLYTGELVMAQGADPSILDAVENLGSGVNWDFIPYPTLPAGPVGVLHNNFYGMLASASDKELAWELLKFAAVDPEWQRFYMKMALSPPGQAALLQEWTTLLTQLAPILQTKHLEYWTQPTINGEGIYDYQFFKYHPGTANSYISDIWPKLWAGQISVTRAFTQAAALINNLESTAAAAAAKSSTSASKA